MDLLSQTETIVHGCTIVTNAIVQRAGARTGLIATKGHEEAIIIGRQNQKLDGLSDIEKTHVTRHHKVDPPIVTRELICGISERMDVEGEIIVPLNEAEVEDAIEDLVTRKEVQAIAVSLLWSFVNPAHEVRVKELIKARYPDIEVSLSSEVMPVLGEHERTLSTVFNAYTKSLTRSYVTTLAAKLRQAGYKHSLLFMGAHGGLLDEDEAKEKSIFWLNAGPIGGTIASRELGDRYTKENIICSDVGGTTFDVSLVIGRELQRETEPVVHQYRFYLPSVSISSIGAGGGSIIWVDEAGIMRVGPRSAGADPGPVCYGRGGTSPTITDADLLLGFINPESFLGGRMNLDLKLAEASLQNMGRQLNMSAEEVATGAVRIVEAQMADLIRQRTIEYGLDPREFALVVYGGSGPVHGCNYSSELGITELYVPEAASVFSAFGLLMGDMLYTFEASNPLRSPLTDRDMEIINATFKQLEDKALHTFANIGVKEDQVIIIRTLRMKYKLQYHLVEVSISQKEYSSADADMIEEALRQRYISLYGPGTVVEGAEFEIISFRVDAVHKPFHVSVRRQEATSGAAAPEPIGSRSVLFTREGRVLSQIYAGDRLHSGHVIMGPAIIERMGDTVVIPPGFVAKVDPYKSIIIRAENK
ncbi:MAG: hydantoinase/oxoprolinase family protein [Clostridia bacterium]|nr:MAG: hydantoinase/oxoprolinase family protein [Clostridia bacterium]